MLGISAMKNNLQLVTDYQFAKFRGILAQKINFLQIISDQFANFHQLTMPVSHTDLFTMILVP